MPGHDGCPHPLYHLFTCTSVRTHPRTVESSSLPCTLISTWETTTIWSAFQLQHLMSEAMFGFKAEGRSNTAATQLLAWSRCSQTRFMWVWGIAASTPHPYSARVHRSRDRIHLRKVVWDGDRQECGTLVFILIKCTGVCGQPFLNPWCQLVTYLVFILFIFVFNFFFYSVESHEGGQAKQRMADSICPTATATYYLEIFRLPFAIQKSHMAHGSSLY